ncbi:hypothetical protein GTA08_BOTSDO01098 [Botryosphaeria dothidea]|uniref:Fungal N-terminal domain-containing protein n=1 Tax=Botryosphaeria dothidea TaxID=55169 RepID=A0A8H4NCK2_9PEZI|nr:hypothetical protein GTA08_BOTSDO01098 [Botryosphaeria dothidea]
MAETLGVIASSIQVADLGFKLARNIYDYAEAYQNSDKRLKDVARDVRLTCNVVGELEGVFNHPATKALKKDKALATAHETLEACESVFGEIQQSIEKARKNKLLLPFRQPKMDMLSANLDRLKSTLMLLVAVLQHAYHIASDEKKRDELRELMRAKDEAKMKLNFL